MSKRSLKSSEDDIDAVKGTSKKKTKAGDGISGSSVTHSPFEVTDFDMTRTRLLSNPLTTTPIGTGEGEGGDCVIYWMSRDQRVQENHAMLYAQGLAKDKGLQLKVCFNLWNTPDHDTGTIRAWGFMLKGLQEVEEKCRSLNIPFHMLIGDVSTNVPEFARTSNAACLVTDFSPLRHSLLNANNVASALDAPLSSSSSSDKSSTTTVKRIPVVQVDAHNVVPVWEASPKLEYAARTMRPKITAKLPMYLKEFPELMSGFDQDQTALVGCKPVDWKAVWASLDVDTSVKEVTWCLPGYREGMKTFESFVSERLKLFAEKRNDPNVNASSNLSPYIHYGHISVQHIVKEIKRRKLGGASVDSFVEEVVVRKELSDNFCFYNQNYDSLTCCSQWAQDSLALHTADKREWVYTRSQLEEAKTHDDLWNAAQIQLRLEGKMHGFLRMYWAKKILEWTDTPERALKDAIYLNDRFSLDGRDPNGFVGVLWSIGGIHDMGWTERPIFGKIRFMNYAGCKRKFNIPQFVAKYAKLSGITPVPAPKTDSKKK
jgi:deoxyribodipyrimidine photo-lyase